ncbi:hypothetical protein [Cohnella panacarvi]|uniref:hypothetical protein n=1 Tax=Cohnella panacarvi TaxID=400776 RepID=UPI000479332B|nr:hypothetical protein [Cohnella panacarvi]
MNRKVLMSSVLLIVLVLGVLGQAVAAKVITPSPYEPAPARSFADKPFPGVKGGVPNVCSYSGFIAKYYTFKCATEIEYSPSGLHATGIRSFTLNIRESLDYTELREYIDEFAKNYSYYRAVLDKFLKDWNRTSVTWDELNNYSKYRSQMGFDAALIVQEVGFLQSDLDAINHFIEAWILP